jgi:AcrR family transcriptional regulator
MAEIVVEATRLISERGFNGVSLQTVAEACKMSVPGLLHYVTNKDGLLVAVLAHRDATDLAEAGIRPHRGGNQDPRAFLDALVRRNSNQRELVRLYTVLNAESLNPEHPAHEYYTQRYLDSLAVVADLLRPQYEDAERLAADVIAAMDGLQIQWLRFPESVDLFEYWSRAADALFGSATRRTG